MQKQRHIFASNNAPITFLALEYYSRCLHLHNLRSGKISPSKNAFQHQWGEDASMSAPLIAGVGVAAAALLSRELVKQYVKFKAAPAAARAFYKGGFQQEMTRREAALILGLRESAAEERVKEAHRRIMIANHPDSGGSSFVAAKVNEAKDVLLGKKNKGSVF